MISPIVQMAFFVYDGSRIEKWANHRSDIVNYIYNVNNKI